MGATRTRSKHRADSFKLKRKEVGIDLPEHDAQALAAIALGSIINYRVEVTLFGEPPAAVPEERFIKSWVDVWATYGEWHPMSGLE